MNLSPPNEASTRIHRGDYTALVQPFQPRNWLGKLNRDNGRIMAFALTVLYRTRVHAAIKFDISRRGDTLIIKTNLHDTT